MLTVHKPYICITIINTISLNTLKNVITKAFRGVSQMFSIQNILNEKFLKSSKCHARHTLCIYSTLSTAVVVDCQCRYLTVAFISWWSAPSNWLLVTRYLLSIYWVSTDIYRGCRRLSAGQMECGVHPSPASRPPAASTSTPSAHLARSRHICASPH